MLRTIALVVIVAAFGSGVANAQQKSRSQRTDPEGQTQPGGFRISFRCERQISIARHRDDLRARWLRRTTSSCWAWYSLHDSWGTHVRPESGKTTIYKAGDCYYGPAPRPPPFVTATDKPTVLLVFEICRPPIGRVGHAGSRAEVEPSFSEQASPT